jgi:excisionase family DNA binding protein
LAELLDFVRGIGLERRARVNLTNSWTTMADKDTLLNSREVAFLLDLSPDTVNEFARRSILPAFKKGRQWRFRKRDIASFKRHLRGLNAAA